MPTILDNILADKRIELQSVKEQISVDSLQKSEYFERETISFSSSLANSQSGIIAEFKRKSPSKGWIHADADMLGVTKGYSDNGASAISILTNDKYFGGCPEFIVKARPNIKCPILRKEFIVDEFQVIEAKAIGADAILLIAAALTPVELKSLAKLAHSLNLEVLMEVHTEQELGYLNEYVDVVGVNNRDLNTFITSIDNSVKLIDKLPSDVVKISESGISNANTVKELRKLGFRGFLMGENFMKEANPDVALKNFINEVIA